MNDTYGELFRNVIHPAWESGVRRRPTLQHWRRLERTQWCTLDELQALQLRELRCLLEHACEHVPYYRERFREQGLAAADLRELADLGKFPLLSREEAARHIDARKSRAPGAPLIDKATSGTTGSPLGFAYDQGSEYWRQAT